MAVYDPEDPNNPSLQQREQNAAASEDTPEAGGDGQGQEDSKESRFKLPQTPWQRFSNEDAEEKEALNNQLHETASNLREQDEAADTNPFDSEGSIKQPKGRFAKKKKKWALIAAGGISGLALGSFGLVGLLSNLRMDFILNNIDAKTFARFNATFDNRSDKWMQAYIRVRLMEITGDLDPKQNNILFRANKVDTNSPFYDWWQTVRTSKFEADMFEKSGIKFTSVAERQSDGSLKIRPGKITTKDTELTFDPFAKYDAGLIDKISKGDVASFNRLGLDMDQFVKVDAFENNRAARKAIKKAVKEHTKWHNVIKRRHLRKSIQNMTGIGDWKFYETSKKASAVRDKVLNKKVLIQRKIVKKTFGDNSALGELILCVFALQHLCPTTTDPINPENLQGGKPKISAGAETPNVDTTPELDNTGNIIKTSGLDDELSAAASEELEQVAEDEVIGAATGAASTRLSRNQSMAINITKKIVGDELSSAFPVKVWNYFKRLSSVHHLIIGGTLTAMVMNARQSQAVANYTTYKIAADQQRTGQADSEEVGPMMATTQNFNYSEAWQVIGKANGSGKVSAATLTKPSKEEACSPGHKKSFYEFAYACDDIKPNGGGRADTFTEGYKNTIGAVIAPIVAVVDPVQKSPAGKLFDTATGFVGNLTSKLADKIAGPVINKLLSASGAGNKIADVMAVFQEKLMEFMGVGPMFDGTIPGVANILTIGSAGAAETAMRAMGAIASTAKTVTYTNNLARANQQEIRDSRSVTERYFSLEDPDSFAATSLLAASNLTTSRNFGSLFGAIFSPFKFFGDTLTGRSFAIDTDSAPDAVTNWAGVSKYDTPQECMDLDPLDPDYDKKATNFPDPVDLETLSDSERWGEALYAKFPAQADAEKIYNCALTDNAVKGGLGNVYGFEDDHGLGAPEAAKPPATAAPVPGDGFKNTDTSAMPCPAGSNNLDVKQVPTGEGLPPSLPKFSIRLCGIPEIPGGINVAVTANVMSMIADAKGGGVRLTGNSFRTSASQITLRKSNCGTSTFDIYEKDSSACNPPTARPGRSMHEQGLAIDFECNNQRSFGGRSSPCFVWLAANASKYGFKNLPSEPWHWSTTGN